MDQDLYQEQFDTSVTGLQCDAYTWKCVGRSIVRFMVVSKLGGCLVSKRDLCVHHARNVLVVNNINNNRARDVDPKVMAAVCSYDLSICGRKD